VRDMPGEGGAPPIPGAPIFIELQAQISNPSSFSLSSLDVIDLDIHTDRNEQTGVDGVRFVAVRTPPGFYVARGTSPWWPISGKLEVPPRELDMYSVSSLFARLLKHDASDSRLGLSVEMRGDSRRFYDAAVRGLAIGAALPPLQLQKPAHGSSMPYPFVQAAHIDLDIPKARAARAPAPRPAPAPCRSASPRPWPRSRPPRHPYRPRRVCMRAAP